MSVRLDKKVYEALERNVKANKGSTVSEFINIALAEYFEVKLE